MTPTWTSRDGRAVLYLGDCREVMADMPGNSVDSIVTDPPYGLSFMGKRWDYDVPGVEVWAECLRVLKPGGHLLAFAGTRTQHRMCCRIEDAGFEIRDMIAWVYGSGFPKSLNLDGEWDGWGTAIKPALEPITLARKPLAGTVEANSLAHGCGALNVDGCRIGDAERPLTISPPKNGKYPGEFRQGGIAGGTTTVGRWPANLIHDGSEEVLAAFPRECPSDRTEIGFGDSGSAARFFYCAKADRDDRDDGCEQLELRRVAAMNAMGDDPNGNIDPVSQRFTTEKRNHHPTVKPTDLMRYLCRLVTPKGGTVLDVFCGSGSTGKAAALEGFHFIGIDREADYFAIARARIERALCEGESFLPFNPETPL
jgi:site-specific DNA-methyltransferase (adenine-specific)